MACEEVVRKLWACFDRGEFSAVGPLLHDDFVCDWPQSNERIRGRDNFIALNENYPGEWRMIVKVLHTSAEGIVITETLHRRSDGESVTSLSFFTLRDGQIIHLREFWADPYPAPDWRKAWVEPID